MHISSRKHGRHNILLPFEHKVQVDTVFPMENPDV